VSGLETAIRNALERSDRSNAEIRARIYQSARQALENGLQKQQIEDPEVIARQRHRLEAVIHAIETEERAALKARAPATPVVSLGGLKSKSDSAGAVEQARREPGFKSEARAAAPADGGLEALRPDRDGPMVATRPATDSVGPGAAAAGAAVWWVQTNDLLKSPAERDTNVVNPPATVETEDFDGAAALPTLGAQEGFSADWIEVFTAADAAALKPGARASVQPFAGDGGERVRVTSKVAAEDGNVAIEIPADVLAELSGKSSTLALTVQAMPGKTTEFSVECDFSTLGACGRHRFTAHDERLDMLFKVAFDRSLAPKSPGKLLINSDVSGAGNGLDIFAIRVLPGQ
jgi:hypothetical protein